MHQLVCCKRSSQTTRWDTLCFLVLDHFPSKMWHLHRSRTSSLAAPRQSSTAPPTRRRSTWQVWSMILQIVKKMRFPWPEKQKTKTYVVQWHVSDNNRYKLVHLPLWFQNRAWPHPPPTGWLKNTGWFISHNHFRIVLKSAIFAFVFFQDGVRFPLTAAAAGAAAALMLAAAERAAAAISAALEEKKNQARRGENL